MYLKNILASAFLTSLLAIPSISLAQETGTGTTQTGSGTVTEVDPRIEERETRSTGFRQAVLKARTALNTIHAEQKEIRSKRMSNARTCRDAIRSANKEMKMSTLLECMRKDLTFEKEYTQNHKEMIELLPGLQKEAKDRALARTQNLIDALDAVLEGINRGVYGTEEEMREGKRNLTAKYRITQWTGAIHARSDAMLSWIAHTLMRIDTIQEENIENAEVLSLLGQAETCLVEAESQLAGVFVIDNYQNAKTAFGQGLIKLKSCTDLIASADKKRTPTN